MPTAALTPATEPAATGEATRSTEAPTPAVQAPASEPMTIPPTSPPVSAPTPTASLDAAPAQIERRVREYFRAFNAGDYAEALAVCCTPGWRSRHTLEERGEGSFAGVTDLRYSSEFRYTTVGPTQVVVEVDYSFVSRRERRYFVLRWTFVPADGEWLADHAQAFPQPT